MFSFSSLPPPSVGVGNLKYFLHFCSYTCCLCVFVFCVIFSRILACPSSNISMCFDARLAKISDAEFRAHSRSYSEDSAWGFVVIILIIMECFIFGLFTLAMSLSQVAAVTTDETQLESWQRERDSKKRTFSPNRRQPPKALPLAAQLTPNAATHAQASASGESISSHLAPALPVAQPLPPTTMTRARNCRMVFVGSAHSPHTAPTLFSSSRYPCLQSSSSKLNPLVCSAKAILILPNLLATCLTSSFLHYLIPTPVRHDDYPRVCNYRMPAPGVQTIIDVVDTGSSAGRTAGSASASAGQQERFAESEDTLLRTV